MHDLEPEDVDWIVVHCSAGRPDATVDDIRRAHVEGRGWSDTGYHLLIDPDGNVHGGRPLWKQGAHALGFNHRSLSICLIGHYDEGRDPLTPAMWSALVALLHALSVSYEVPAENIIGHRETYDALGQRRLKTCPGTAVDLDQLRDDVRRRRGLAGV